MADLSVLVIAKGCMPFQAASTMANCSILQRKGQYPKIERIMNDCLAYPAVANFLKNSEHKTLTADPFGIMPAELKKNSRNFRVNREMRDEICGI